jgi:hypothetical protein
MSGRKKKQNRNLATSLKFRVEKVFTIFLFTEAKRSQRGATPGTVWLQPSSVMPPVLSVSSFLANSYSCCRAI